MRRGVPGGAATRLHPPVRSRPLRLILAAIVSVTGFAVLVSLGAWQLARLDWKEGLLAEMETRLAAQPAPLPAAPSPQADRFRATRLEGRIETPGIAVFGTWRGGGAGYRIVNPFRTDDGRTVLLDRGIAAAPEAARRAPEGRIAVEGHLDWPADPDAAPGDLQETWTVRNVGALARTLGTEPVLVVARATSEAGGAVTPVPIDTAGIPNSHLGYAIQWFGLALVWGGMAGYWFWRALRRGEVR